MSRETRGWLAVITVLLVLGAGVQGWRMANRKPAVDDGEGKGPEDITSADNQGPGSESAVAPEILHDAPTFQLTDQSGAAFGTSELAGKVWVGNFMFTRCKATCPAQTKRMRELQRYLQTFPVASAIRLLSITVDPEFDTSEVLNGYALATNANTDQWKFLTGKRSEIWEMSKSGFHLPLLDSTENADAPISHDSKFILVDRGGRVRGFFDVLEDDGMTQLKKALDFVVPEIAKDDTPGVTHLAQPPDILDIDWFADRQREQTEAVKNSKVFHDFKFHNVVSDSGIDFDPQIVDEQRWRMQVNHYDHGNGIAVADVNGDDLLDIYLVAQAGSNGLYENLGGGKFKNVTAEAGVAVSDRIGVTAAFADMDNDGDADLFVTSIRGGNLLFVNDGTGHFADISQTAGVDYVGHSSAAVFFDYDRDGLLDLFVTNVGKFTTEEFASLRLDPTSKLPPGDYKYYVGTGDAFARHRLPQFDEPSILYKNMGDNRFENVTDAMGLNENGWNGAATTLDVNRDGWLDLYILNMQGHDEYFENQEGKAFVRKSREVFPRTPWGAMGVKSFDWDNDGRFDMLVTDMHSDMSEDVGPKLEKKKSNMTWDAEFLMNPKSESVFGNAFFHRQTDGTFKEVSDKIGAENYWPWGLSVGDLNADGFQDAFIASSMCFPYRYSANSVLLNEGGTRFIDAEFAIGVEPRAAGQRIRPWFELDCDGADRDSPIAAGRSGKLIIWSALGSRSSALFDYDGDGDLDIITNDFNSPPLVLQSNLAEQNTDLKWVKIRLRGTQSNRDALGARVEVTAGETTSYQINDGQSGYLSQSRMPLYFGLGGAKEISRVKIVWPSGTEQIIEGPMPANQTLVAEETES
jgi:cytochrome oxidase Cu insertion factor (SCO1/SenC/PrrC family)